MLTELKALPPEALTQLREESSSARNFKDGEIYRIYRQYELLNDTAQARKWWAKFESDDRRKDFRRLLSNSLLREGFDRLLPYIGIWNPLKSTQVERILGMRCHEVCLRCPLKVLSLTLTDDLGGLSLFRQHSPDLVDSLL